MRWRCAAGIFHRSAVLSRRTSALLHLTICFPESDGAANHTSGNKNNQQFPLLTSKSSIQAVMEVVLAVVMSKPVEHYNYAYRAQLQSIR